MPKNICWWLGDGEYISAVQRFTAKLTLKEPPPIESINDMMKILNYWSKLPVQGNINFNAKNLEKCN